MPTIIPVKFTYAARDLWFDPAGTGAQEGDHVICATERGYEIGLAVGDAREVTPEELSSTIGGAQLRDVVRIATEEDLVRADELARRGEESMPAFRRHVAESGLDMKPVGVEYLFDGEKAVCYFAAEERVDFRQLVRDLAREFHVRIDMRQIGVREEAAIVGGYGHCGQELCCRRFATGFDPVSIRMAKEQDLPLNSTKISGACGRLMCCLRYEFEAYRDFKSRAPKRNAVIDTPLGKGKIVEYDTPKEQICLRLENGKQIRVALADMTASEAATSSWSRAARGAAPRPAAPRPARRTSASRARRRRPATRPPRGAVAASAVRATAGERPRRRRPSSRPPRRPARTAGATTRRPRAGLQARALSRPGSAARAVRATRAARPRRARRARSRGACSRRAAAAPSRVARPPAAASGRRRRAARRRSSRAPRVRPSAGAAVAAAAGAAARARPARAARRRAAPSSAEPAFFSPRRHGPSATL